MLRRVVGAGFLLAVASLAAGVSGGTTSPRLGLRLASGEVPTPLLAIRPTEGWGGTLAPVDPLSLRPLGTGQLDLKGAVLGWSFSPDRSRLVLGDQYGRVLFVDAMRLQRLGELRTGLKAPLAASAWVEGRVLAAWRGPGVVRVRLIDPAKRRVLRKQLLDGSLEAVARTPQALVLLLSPFQELGASRLAVVDAAGGVREVEVGRIPSGFVVPEGVEVVRHASPGLAVDPEGGRAFVVGAGDQIAEVDLTTLSLTYHALAQPLSRLGRFDRWLVPAAEAKGAPDGPDRDALWLGDGTLAVFGSDDHGWLDGNGHPQLRVTPAGVRLLDTHAWISSTLDPDATALTAADGILLATASLWDSAAQRTSGIGLVGYGTDGSRRFHLFEDAALLPLVVGRRAFVAFDGPTVGYSIVDLASGRVVDEVREAEPPLVLTGIASTWIG